MPAAFLLAAMAGSGPRPSRRSFPSVFHLAADWVARGYPVFGAKRAAVKNAVVQLAFERADDVERFVVAEGLLWRGAIQTEVLGRPAWTWMAAGGEGAEALQALGLVFDREPVLPLAPGVSP